MSPVTITGDLMAGLALVPHLAQNLTSEGDGVPQTVQEVGALKLASAVPAPHPPQNRVPDTSGLPQLGQNISCPPFHTFKRSISVFLQTGQRAFVLWVDIIDMALPPKANNAGMVPTPVSKSGIRTHHERNQGALPLITPTTPMLPLYPHSRHVIVVSVSYRRSSARI
jgi:hypothetical protein